MGEKAIFDTECACGNPGVKASKTRVRLTKNQVVACEECEPSLLDEQDLDIPRSTQLRIIGRRFVTPQETWFNYQVRLDKNEKWCPPDAAKKTFSFVGPIGHLDRGDIIIALGVFSRHPTYGLQFVTQAKAQLAVKESEEGLLIFLSRFPHIGRSRAIEILRTLGGKDQVLDALDNRPARLMEVKGITAERVEEIKTKYDSEVGYRDFRLFAAHVGLRENVSTAAIDTWGTSAKKNIEDDAFSLLTLGARVSFRAADEIHTKLEKSPTDPNRCAAGVMLALNIACEEGHVYSCKSDLLGRGDSRAAKEIRNLGLEEEAVEVGLKLLSSWTTVYKQRQPIQVAPKIVIDGDRIYPEEMYTAETQIVTELKRIASAPTKIVDVPAHPWGDWTPEPEQKDALQAICTSPVLILTGGPGCISGDTEVMVKTPKNRKCGRKYSIRDAYHKFHRIKREGKGGTKFWSGSCETLSIASDNSINYNEIKNIVFNGIKPVYEIQTVGGRRVSATLDHPFLVPPNTIGADEENYKQLQDLKIDSQVVVRQEKMMRAEIDTITSIKLVGDQPVYDLIMADPHRNYVAGGFVVHNCGKTSTTNVMLDTLESAGFSLSLCAPTGKAAMRMTELTGREASTVHRLIAYNKSSSDNLVIDADVVCLDETTLCDSVLMARLLRAVRTGTRLILVGDVDQLPSIGAGRVLYDLIESGLFPVVRLTKIFRQTSNGETKRIPDVARDVNNGNLFDLTAKGTDVTFLPMDDPELMQQKIVLAVSKQLPEKLGLSPEYIQVISPQKGEEGKKNYPIGVRGLNIALQQALNPKLDFEIAIGDDYVCRAGDRVIHTKNNYDIMVMNGEVGTVLRVSNKPFTPEIDVTVTKKSRANGRTTSTTTVAVVDYGDRKIGYTAEEARELNLSYAVTVHKCQGSSFRCVVMPIHDAHQFMLTRPLLYTAITRAEKYVLLLGTPYRVQKTIGNTRGVDRRTTLQERLHKAWLD